MKIAIKPLSINKAFQGRRFKTKEYKAYEKEALLKLKPMTVESGKLSLLICFGLSSKNADIDNCLKLWIDILQLKYGFNDRHIYRLDVTKIDVPKGQEFIEFELSAL